jgi:hypothetical protein
MLPEKLLVALDAIVMYVTYKQEVLIVMGEGAFELKAG